MKTDRVSRTPDVRRGLVTGGLAVGLVAVTLWMVQLGLGGSITLVGASGLGLIFLAKAWKGLRTNGGAAWARNLFLYSLIYLSGLFIFMVVDHVL